MMSTHELPPQFTMERQQHVTLNEEQATAINNHIDLMEVLTKKRVSVNRFMKAATIQKAQRTLEEGKN